MPPAKRSKEKESDKEGKAGDLESLIENLKSRFGEGAIMKLGDQLHTRVETIPSGSFSLDLALGGGLPKGRIIEIYGPESSGKTTLALHAVAEVQRRGGKAAFIDAEHALDPEYATRIGVKIKDLIISQPDNGEEALNILESLVRSGIINIIVVDSVAALTPRAEIEGEMGQSHVGLQARLLSQALRKLTGIAAKTGTIIIFINQLRMKIGIMFGNPETTPGGMALKFYASVRLDIRKIENIKQGDQVVGSRHRVKVVKNKVAPPFRIAEFDMDENGVVHESEILDVGIELEILSKSGAFIRWGDKMLGQGRQAAIAYLKENKKEADQLEKEIREAWAKQKSGEDKLVVGKEDGEDDVPAIEEAV
jgi:recombination protein RecA